MKMGKTLLEAEQTNNVKHVNKHVSRADFNTKNREEGVSIFKSFFCFAKNLHLLSSSQQRLTLGRLLVP